MQTTSALPDRSPLFVAQPPQHDNEASRIKRLMIANRGEIACRIIATCNKLNVATIAVFVSEDKLSRHIALADEAICMGSIEQPGGNPYLDAKKLLDIAVNAKADAIHPGYGYLSENAGFAEIVRAAGLIFVGPSCSAMSTLGDKRTAKEYLRSNDPEIPLIPGFSGSSQDTAELEEAAKAIGYPIMLKASAGGGGKGMRIVQHQEDMGAELKSAQSEAARSFGSSDCILEKYIETGKHIEIQIIGDSHGNVVSLHERECSIQRRHQKVIEETPSPWMKPQTRKRMNDAAIRIGKLLGYENAGTVEFVIDAQSGDFYFLEVNTRLQVEHPITEEVTGLDIVSLQLFVAAGGSLLDLPILRAVPQVGHAIECRLCAEDPGRDFYPERGTVRLWKPANALQLGIDSVRFETAVETGSEVSIYFDSMIAKIIVWAPTRSLAISNMVRVLQNTACVGVRTNQLFLQSCLSHRGFLDPSYTTSFIAQNLENLLLNPHVEYTTELRQILSIVPCLFAQSPGISHSDAGVRPFRNVRFAFRNQVFDSINKHADIVTSSLSQPLVCTWAHRRHEAEEHRIKLSSVPAGAQSTGNETDGSPVALQIAAQYNTTSDTLRNDRESSITDGQEYLTATLNEIETNIVALPTNERWLRATADATIGKTTLRASIVTDGCQVLARSIMRKAEPLVIMCHFPLLGDWIEFRVYSILSFYESLRQSAATSLGGTMKRTLAPMPCRVITVLKKDGDIVEAGEPIMVVESMKMEMNISLPAAGEVKLKVNVNDAVEEGVVLCEVD